MAKESAQISWHLITSAGLRTEPATPRPLCNLLYPELKPRLAIRRFLMSAFGILRPQANVRYGRKSRHKALSS